MKIHRYVSALLRRFEDTIKLHVISHDISFSLLRTESNTILRKTFEATFIFHLKTNINEKEEKKVRFLVSMIIYTFYTVFMF